MMLFKLSLKNVKKCFKDYAVYFMTLILGVAIFYLFNALDSQEAMLKISQSMSEIFQLMLIALSGVSVCVAMILGFLIVYANNFLIRRRKKEFAVYMTLGMGRRKISRILFGETILIGIASLGIGLAIGIFASQFMSILVSKMFEVDVTSYTFVYSQPAMLKTVIYFSVMYLIVILFNVFAVSKCKLIDLFQAAKKTEKNRLKSSGLAVVVFLAAVMILGYAYYQVTVNSGILGRKQTLGMMALGCVGTFLVFWSLSGFLLKLLKRSKKFYYKGLNAFVLRQVNSSVNTAVFSMTVISLLFFVTICVLSTGLALNNAFRKDLQENCPVDLNLSKEMDTEALDSRLSVAEAFEKTGLSLALLKPGYREISVYHNENIIMGTTMGKYKEIMEEKYPYIRWESKESIVGLSEYNKMAALYGQPTHELGVNEYLVICTVAEVKKIRDMVLTDGDNLQIGSFALTPKYQECQKGYLYMNMSSMELGTIIVPDIVIAEEYGNSLKKVQNLLAADYAAETEAEKSEIEDKVINLNTDMLDVELNGITKDYIYGAAVGLSAVATFIGIYLGVVFLIAGAALLALKELAESTDNKDRYTILQKIGADKKMQNKALLWQMGIFFGMPMLLAVIHSIFGLQYAQNLLSMYSTKDILPAICATAVLLVVIYGAYFLATYMGSRRIIEE